MFYGTPWVIARYAAQRQILTFGCWNGLERHTHVAPLRAIRKSKLLLKMAWGTLFAHDSYRVT